MEDNNGTQVAAESSTAESASADSLPAGQGASAASPPADSGAKESQSIADFLREKGSEIVEEGSPPESKKPDQVEPGGASDATTDEPSAAEGATPVSNDLSQAKEELPPFHKHGAWQRKQEQVRKLTEERDGLKSRTAVLDELRSYTGGDAGFENAKTLMRTYAQAPSEAIPMLKQLLADAEQRAGLVLTRDDLKERVDAGVLDEATALKIQRAEQFAQQQESAQRTAAVEQSTRAEREAVGKAVQAWVETTKRNDPDFQRKEQLIIDRSMRMVEAEAGRRGRNLNPQEMVAIASAAHAQVTRELGEMLPRSGGLRATTSQGSSSTNTRTEPRSIRDAIRMAAEKL